MALVNKNKAIIEVEKIRRIENLISRMNLSNDHITSIKKNHFKCLNCLNEALTHSSFNQKINHERLEFLGDAVLRLAASEFIQIYFPEMKVGERSVLRSHLVSDQWLAKVGEDMKIIETLSIDSSASKDKSARQTIQAETTEALIGALYECLNDIEAIHSWLTPYWQDESDYILKDPHKYNCKSALQEWSQRSGFSIPKYQVQELSQGHGDPKRFYCEVLISENIFARGWGKSIKESEKEAAYNALKQIEVSEFKNK